MSKEVNIKSSTIEKGLEIAKDFLEKLILPAVEETGMLIKDQITLWRLKNQIKILIKAKQYCEKHNIEPKKVNLKLLIPLIETSSLEEDDLLQDKWAILLSNMVDSEQNIENHVFPHILGQISKNEFLYIEKGYLSKKSRNKNINKELTEFIDNYPQIKGELEKEIKELDEKIQKEGKNNNNIINKQISDLEKKKRKLESKLSELEYREVELKIKIIEPEILPDDKLKNFEISNLIRLGLIKEQLETIANPQTLEIPNKKKYLWDSFSPDYTNVDVEIDIETYSNYILTELGEIFVKACMEKE